jgi:hypothetical protein
LKLRHLATLPFAAAVCIIIHQFKVISFSFEGGVRGIFSKAKNSAAEINFVLSKVPQPASRAVT